MTPAGIPKAVPRARRPRRAASASGDSRQRFLDAAIDVVRQEGLGGLRIDAIAQRAGLSVGAFYLHFKSKDDLIVEVVVSAATRLREAMNACYREPGPLATRLSRSTDAHLAFAAANEHLYLYLDAAGGLETTEGALRPWVLEVMTDDLAAVLEAAMSDGEIRPMDAWHTAYAMVSSNLALAAHWLKTGQAMPADELRTLLLSLFSFGVAPK